MMPLMNSSSVLTDHFLIALPGLTDPNFSRSVALVCQHSEREGAMGLIINRLSEYCLGDVLRQMNIQTNSRAVFDVPVLAGGPIHPERGFVLHPLGGTWESSFPISQRLAVTTSRDILSAMARGEGPGHAVVTLGYAGWEPGQLEHELSENSWLTVKANDRIVFETPLEERWLAAARLMGVDVRLLTDYSGHA